MIALHKRQESETMNVWHEKMQIHERHLIRCTVKSLEKWRRVMTGSCERNSAGTASGVEPVAPFVLGPVASCIVLCESMYCSAQKMSRTSP
jgi:hypothetical protein